MGPEFTLGNRWPLAFLQSMAEGSRQSKGDLKAATPERCLLGVSNFKGLQLSGMMIAQGRCRWRPAPNPSPSIYTPAPPQAAYQLGQNCI